MGMDFNVNVKVKTSGADVVDRLENQINSLKHETINLKVNLAGDGANLIKTLSSQMAQMNAIASKTGQNIGKAYGNAILQNTRKAQVEYQHMWNALSAQTKQFKLDQASAKLSTLKSNNMGRYEGSSSYLQYNANLEKAAQLQAKLNAEIAKGKNANMDAFNADLKEMNSLLTKSATLFNNLTRPISSMEATSASNKTLSWLKNNSKASKELGNQFRDLAKKQKNVTTYGELQKYNKEFSNLVSLAQSRGLTGNSIFTELSRGFKAIGQFVGTYGIYMRAVRTLKQMASAVVEVDDAMTELRKVTDAPMSQISAYYDEAAESAKKYGQTISDVIKNTADWQRLGYNLKDAKQLSDMTTLYQNVGDNMTQESASSSMVSTLQGFQLAADQAEHIVDAFNEVGNNFAIGSDGIGEALRRSASSMYAAGNTMEQTIGLVTAANEVVQDPDVVGTAFKTISMRIRGKIVPIYNENYSLCYAS